MKSLRILPMVALMSAAWISSLGQALEPEVPGDQFSLEGALELFKKSESPEEFEKLLNSPDSKVNNLDLNADGYVDYIRVFDRNEGNVHAFVLQAMISETESQDVAVIELEKLANGKAVLQIVGDEAVYGIETIIEPTHEVRTYAGTQTTRTVVNVWAWPSVQYVYGPRYVGWTSPWRWHRLPVWYIGWSPVAYVHYYPVWRPYYHYYTPCYTRRIVYAPRIYRPYRTVSVVVRNRYHDRITRYRSEHRDDDRYGRSRRDDRRSYVSNNRPATSTDVRRNDSDQHRRYSPTREVTRPSRDNDAPRRTTPAETSRRYQEQKSDMPGRSRTAVPDRAETQRRVTPPAAPDRSRSNPNPNSNRHYTPQRSVPAQVQRSSPVQRTAPQVHRNSSVQRSTTPERRPSTVAPRRESPAPVVTRPSVPARKSSGSPAIHQRSYERSSGASGSDSRRGRY